MARLVFQVNKQNYSKARVVEQAEPGLLSGQIRVSIDRFAFTSNNITYAVLGERIQYWEFFPVDSADKNYWGVIPVWGFADVVESNQDDMPVGERLFGYFPPATTLVMTPSNIAQGSFIEASEHRKALPIAYNLYKRVSSKSQCDQSLDDEAMVFSPLFLTAYCLHNMLSENAWYGAEQIIILSASSKTSIGLAYALADDSRAPKVIGLTSKANIETLDSLAVYDQNFTYDAISQIDKSKPTVIVDMSGNADVLSRLHLHLAENMRFTSNVGITHWDHLKPVSGIITERSEMFFAPSQMQRLIKELGLPEYNKRTSVFIAALSEKIRPWMNFKQVDSLAGLHEVYVDVCEGKIKPNVSLCIKL